MGSDYSRRDLAVVIVGTALAIVAIYLGQLAHDRLAVALACVGLMAGYLGNVINGPWTFKTPRRHALWLGCLVGLMVVCIGSTAWALWRVLVV